MKSELCILIPAIKKNVAFPDDLIKKLGGTPLIQRIIDTGKSITSADNIVVATDSQEIGLVCEKNGVRCFYNPELRLKGDNILQNLRVQTLKLYREYPYLLIMYPYAPLISPDVICDAYNVFKDKRPDVLVSVKKQRLRVYGANHASLGQTFLADNHSQIMVEVKGFVLLRSNLIREKNTNPSVEPFILEKESCEITSYRDWWVCEKLLKRRRIVFRVIGNRNVGMGHIYRCLTLAHEITDHEIIFVSDKSSMLAVNRITGSDYLIHVFPDEEIADQIVALEPHLVINDILDTDASYVRRLRDNGIRVVNFEDLGSGACHSNITFNELYAESATDESGNIFWGHEYFFLREEFLYAVPRSFQPMVRNILVTFGGTDQHNLTQKVLSRILPICKQHSIFVQIVTGPGYSHKNDLAEFIRNCGYEEVDFTFATGIISKLMEAADIAVCSNGRTVYELAHMNIPSIVISQHKREETHGFACADNGFLSAGCVEDGCVQTAVEAQLKHLVLDIDYRRALFDRMVRFDFLKNKSTVVSMIQKLVE